MTTWEVARARGRKNCKVGVIGGYDSRSQKPRNHVGSSAGLSSLDGYSGAWVAVPVRSASRA